MVQKLCAISIGKEKMSHKGADTSQANIKQVLIDKRENIIPCFVTMFANRVSTNLNILVFFRRGLSDSDEDAIVDLEYIIQSVL